jgi:hypothetical protein
MGYLFDSVEYSIFLLLECFTDVDVFSCILSADGEVFGFPNGRGYLLLNPSVKLHALLGSVASDLESWVACCDR